MIDSRMETFLTLCRCMNYRKTAETLSMTQPAVTQHIHYLENLYGCKLFLYDRKTLQMTKEAHILKKYAENVLYQESKLREQLRPTNSCHYSIGATKTIGEYVIGEHIGNYLSHEENTLSVVVDNTEHLLEKLSSGELDFALIEGYFDRNRFSSRLYRTEPFVGICGNNHPFAGSTVSPRDLWDQDLILREEGSGTRNILELLLAERSHAVNEFRRISTISNFGLMMTLLKNNLSITFAYRAVKNSQPDLAEFRVEGWDTLREFNYVYLDTPFSEEAVTYFDSFR